MTVSTLLYKIAKAYYEDGLTQDQIGRTICTLKDQGFTFAATGAPEPGGADHHHATGGHVR